MDGATLTGAAALLGTALIGGLATYAITRHQWRREDSLRYLDQKRGAYAEVLALSFNLGACGAPTTRHELTASLWRAVAEAQLLAPEDVGDLARQLAADSFDLSVSKAEAEGRGQLEQAVLSARKNFMTAARLDLHVKPT